jgi:hypothetical protein
MPWWFVRLPDEQQPDNMKNYNLKAALAANTEELKSDKAPRAQRIVLGVDAHLRSYQVARKIDNAAIGTVANFRSQEEFELYVERQRRQAEQVVVVYEAGPLGYVLYRALKARGVECYVCAPDSSLQKKTRRKSNQIDARTLASNLFKLVSLKFAFERKNMLRHIFLAESEAKHSGPGKKGCRSKSAESGGGFNWRASRAF